MEDFDRANKSSSAMESGEFEDRYGKWGLLPDGRRVCIRPQTSYTTSTQDKTPVMEIYNPCSKHSIKVRYTGDEETHE